MGKYAILCVLVVLLIGANGDTPPGIANNPSHATCNIKRYKTCYNLPHVCPKFCPDSCSVNCVSCKPYCGPASAPPPDTDTPPPPPTPTPAPAPKAPPPSTPPTPSSPTPSPAPSTPTITPPSPPTPTPPAPTPSIQNPSPSTPPTPAPSTPTPPAPTPSTSTPPTPTPSPSIPPTPSTPVPPTPAPTPSIQPPSPSTPPTPVPPTPTPATPPSPIPSTPTPPTPPAPYSPSPSPGDSTEVAAGRRQRCKNRNYPQCYGVEHACPTSCPYTCEVDCVTCKPVCKCDMPGAVCQDPRFIGADGITFYFHGKKDRDFCLVTDPNLHINAHFIGRRNENMRRDFTWVQSIAILFGDHRLFVGAKKTATWDDAVDRISLAFDGEPVGLSTMEGTTWKSAAFPTTTVRRDSDTNSVVIQVEGLFKISAKVVPITPHESRIHNYGITEDDCFAHLELGFKFFSLDGNVNGVLGQTYRDNYVSRVKMGVQMPVLGGEREFAVSNIFATDCVVSLFRGGELRPENNEGAAALELPSMKCGSGIGGRGVVCKR